MTITIELSPEEDARLHAEARLRGQAVEAVAGALVRAGLENGPDAAPPAMEVTAEGLARLNQSLREAGLLTEMPTRPLGPPPQPITVSGPPVSQTLLEDRES